MSDRETLLTLAKVAKAFVEWLERWPDSEKTCSPGCDSVTPAAAGDETVTELGRLAASVLSEDTLRRLDAMRRDEGETVTVVEFDEDAKSEPDPGDGYRWVRPGEIRNVGDEFRSDAGSWEVVWHFQHQGGTVHERYRYRRRIDAAPETTPRADEVRSEVRSEPVDDGGVDAIMERIKNGTSTNDDARVLAMRLRCADAGIAGWREATEKANAQVERLVKDVEQLRASRHALARALTTARGFIPKKHGFGVLEDVHQMIDDTLRNHGGAA
jgi:hypothetical protein